MSYAVSRIINGNVEAEFELPSADALHGFVIGTQLHVYEHIEAAELAVRMVGRLREYGACQWTTGRTMYRVVSA